MLANNDENFNPNDTDDLKAAEEKVRQAKERKKQEIKEERHQSLIEGAREFLAENPNLYFVGKSSLYGLWQNGEWTWLTYSAITTMYADLFTIDGFGKAFKVAMQEAGRCFRDCTHSFEDTTGKLNLMIRDNWLKPIEGEHHWLFDRLMQSIGGGKPENIDHLERVIAYKMAHPECITLPAILMNGEGNLGKNLLVETVLACIWDGATLAATANNIIGSFNSLCAGMLAILVDETSPKRVDHDELKHRLQRAIIEINMKGVPQYQTANLALYFISSNRKAGGVWLDRTKADRRFSVFHIDAGLDLIHWIRQEHPAWDVAMATEWMKREGLKICQDRAEVAKWMHHLLTTYAGQTEPNALHGQDYRRLLDIQMPAEEDIIPAVFRDEQFTHINRQTLYEGYQLRSRADNREPISSRLFYDAVRTFLRLNPDLDIAEQEMQQRQGSDNVRIWGKKGRECRYSSNNDSQYIDQNTIHHRWKGPVSE